MILTGTGESSIQTNAALSCFISDGFRTCALNWQCRFLQCLNYTGEIISMSKAIANLQAAQQRAMSIRPKVGGFPYLAEALRQAGVTRNQWSLPSCQSLFLTNEGSVVM